MIKMGSFRSYVGLEEYEMEIPKPVNGTFLQPKFLDGEIVIAEAENVLKFSSISKKNGLSGSLFVTNARLVFVSSDHLSTDDSIPLLAINTFCFYEEPKGTGGRKIKRKVKLGHQALESSPGNTALFCSSSTRVQELLVNCSNFRCMRVSFKFSLLDRGQKICNALMHWSLPTQPEKLFYMDYCRTSGRHYQSMSSVPMYNIPGDWLREIKISRTAGYRLSTSNMNFEICESLQEGIVVPSDVPDVRVVSLAAKLKGSRPPFWVWGDVNGSAILRMSQLHNEADCGAENLFFETLRKAHPQKRPPIIQNLDVTLPLKEIRVSLTRLFQLCCPESLSHVEDADSSFLINLDNTRWLSWVSKVLHISLEVAETIVNHNDVVILQENESRETSCLIGSLSQILLDARFRTITGLFTLIQKDWIATGHPFHSNFVHSSALFLLFLDSVHQLVHQNPFDFEFNETLLSDIWDSCFDPTTGSFLFDTPSQRKKLDLRRDLNVWNRILSKDELTEEEAEEEDVYRRQPRLYPVQTVPKSLLNAYYKLKNILNPPSPSSFRNNHPPLLDCNPAMPNIRLWRSLYLDRIPMPFDLNPSPAKLTVNSPHKPHGKNLKVASIRTPNMSTTSSRGSFSSSSPSPNHLGAVFLYSSNKKPETESRILTSGGHDYLAELSLVESLFEAATLTSKKHRGQLNNSSNSTNSTTAAGLPRDAVRRHLESASTPTRSVTPQSMFGPRKNPFLETS